MKIANLALACGLAFLALQGCSSSSDSENPKRQCDDLIATLCTSVADCEVSGGLIQASERPSEVDACSSAARQALDCSRAQGVSSSYDACMTKLANPPCDDVNQAIIDGTLPLPSDCEGVILIGD
jgi:hypothetical protein